MTLSVRVVGVGDAFTRKHWNACLLFESSGQRLLVDAPPALAHALEALGERGGPRVSLDDVDAVLITHVHGDHVGGLEQLLFWHRFVTRRRITLHALPDVLRDLWDGRLRGGMDRLVDQQGVVHRLGLDDYALVVPLQPGTNQIGPFALEWRPTVHHVPTSAIRVKADGHVLGYSADTSFDRELIDWLAQSDLFFHETNYGIHTPLDSLVALPEATRKKMRLIHYPDDLDPDRSPIPCAREGERYDL
jgi:ribonuclease BN (tRNA processing enzyme)